jgi:mono/diheme cytochrome c family protein
MRSSRFVRLVMVLATVCAARVHAQSPADARDSVARAAAARQLDLGDQWFHAVCVSCHAVGVLTNADFRLKWNGMNAFDLFERIRSTMPASHPGSLTMGTYAAIVAYLMKLNGMSVGARVVTSDSTALAAIRLSFTAAAPMAR